MNRDALYRWGYRFLGYGAVPFYSLGLGWAVRRHVSPCRYLRLRLQGPPEELGERPVGSRLLWVHAVSVGEVLTAVPFVQAWSRRHPDWRVLLTTVTPTGHAVARRTWGDGVAYLPMDLSRVVGRWMNRLRPDLLVTVETELWPNLFWQARDRGIPVAVINGRVSDAAFRRYCRIRGFIGSVLRAVVCVCAQSEHQADRFRSLGAPPEVIHVTGSLKFDAVAWRLADVRAPDWLDRWRMGRDLVVFGSWTAPEWPLLREVVSGLVRQAPDVCVLVAPRHVEVAAGWADAWQERGIPTGRRTCWRGEAWSVMVLDTVGELAACYADAAVAVVGGSFHPTQSGHNPIEPAWFGVPVLIGPYHRDFADVVEVFQAGRGIQVVTPPHAEALRVHVEDFLRDSGRRAAWGDRARGIVLAQRGALERTLTHLEASMKAG